MRFSPQQNGCKPTSTNDKSISRANRLIGFPIILYFGHMKPQSNQKPFQQSTTMNNRFMGSLVGTVIAWTLFAAIGFGMWGCPRYNVWQQEMSGRAEFAKAEQNRRILIEEAAANLAS
jgi:hypothetical protein